MDEWHHVEVRVLPFSSVTYAALDGSFDVLSFDDKPDIGYHEGPETSHIIEDTGIVREYAVRFTLLMNEALSRAESVKMIASILEDYT